MSAPTAAGEATLAELQAENDALKWTAQEAVRRLALVVKDPRRIEQWERIERAATDLCVEAALYGQPPMRRLRRLVVAICALDETGADDA